MLRKEMYPPILLSAIICGVYILSLNNIAYPWVDEIGTADTAIKYVLHGNWDSNVWWYTYNPLHAFVLVGWLKVFGISHQSVCSLNVFLALLSSIFLLNTLVKRFRVNGVIYSSCFILLFWSGFLFASTITQGRIDILVLLLLSIYIDELLFGLYSKMHIIKMFVFSFFVMLSSIYPIVLIYILHGTLVMISEDSSERKKRINEIVVVTGGFILSFILICTFYFYNHFFFRFINTYISFNGTLSGSSISFIERLFNSYVLDLEGLVIYVMSVLILIKTKWLIDIKRIIIVIFVGLIPAIMTISGRYMTYYTWLFYIPSIILLIIAFYSLKSKAGTITLIAGSLLSLFSWPLINSSKWQLLKNELIQTNGFIKSNADVIQNCNDIVFIDPLCYYSLLETSKSLYMFKDVESIHGKFQKGINRIVKDPQTKNYLELLFLTYESQKEYGIPYRALIITTSQNEKTIIENYLIQRNRSFVLKQEDNDYFLIQSDCCDN